MSASLVSSQRNIADAASVLPDDPGAHDGPGVLSPPILSKRLHVKLGA